MSGINEIKKKAKISMDEMYENQQLRKEDNQLTGKIEVKQSMQPEAQLENMTNSLQKNNPLPQETFHMDDQTIIHPNNKMEIYPNVTQEVQMHRQANIFPTAKQQSPKIPVYKMSFNLPEAIYKAFNDLYANRMIRGCKTEKSDLICEAIQWLIKMEENHTT